MPSGNLFSIGRPAMKTSPVKIFGLLCFLGCVILAGTFSPASAHSTKGRVKVPLDKEVITVDDAAYFAESRVHRHLYDDKTRETQNRFFVKDFIGLAFKDGKAEVRFQVLDKKTNETFEDSLTIARGENGIWLYRPSGGGAPIEVYTYVSRQGSLLHRHAKWIFAAAAVLCAGILLRDRYRKKRYILLSSGDVINGEAASQDSKRVEDSGRMKGATNKTP
jgi:hypothetical protein